jgi:hypothetical protein
VSDDKSYKVSWDEVAGVARTDWFAGAVCGLVEAQAVDAEIRALGRGKVLSLVDLREVASIDRSAREFFMDQNERYRAVAMVVGSPATRMLANFFLGLKRGPNPVKMFDAEAEAIAWLRRQP